MHESLKSSIIDASAGDLQIAVDEPGGFIYFQLGALFTPPCYRLEYKEDKWDINNDADKSKKKKGRGRKGVGMVVVCGGGFTLSLTATLRRTLTSFVHSENFTV